MRPPTVLAFLVAFPSASPSSSSSSGSLLDSAAAGLLAFNPFLLFAPEPSDSLLSGLAALPLLPSPGLAPAPAGAAAAAGDASWASLAGLFLL